MASTDITAQVARIIALGGTEAQVLAAGPRVVRHSATDWAACNRVTCVGVDALESRLAAASAKRAAAAEITSKIRGGKVLYTKNSAGQWLVWGREDVIVEGIGVTAERRDGSTSQVIITQVGPVLESGDLRYRVAEFRAPVTTTPRLTSSAADEALRIGRRYGVNGQIWDNA
jgi:hypothetical protein